jgi:hypothetical protein
MDRNKDKPAIRWESTELRRSWLNTLCTVEMYFLKRGCSEFEYDEELDVFRFPEDGRFAFCWEFADWALLWERGYRLF